MVSEGKKTTTVEGDDGNSLQVTTVFGDIGRHQWTITVLCMIAYIFGAWNALAYVFFSFPMDYSCAESDGLSHQNVSVIQWSNTSNVLETRKGQVNQSKCTFLKINDSADSTTTDLKCTEWNFDRSFFKESIVSQWSLLCDKSWMVSLSQSVYMAGFLIAVLVFGQLGDKYGRRPIMLTCVTLSIAAGFGVYFSTSFISFAVSRFFVATGVHGLYTTGFVTMMESAGPSYRPILTILLGLAWSVGFITLPGLAYVTRSWANLQLTISCCTLVLVVFWWLMPESSGWLLTQGRTNEAEEVMVKVAKTNGRWDELVTPIVIQKIIHKAEQDRQKAEITRPTVIDLLRTPNMRKKTLVMFYAWFVTSFVYYGLSLNTGDLGGDIFENFAISGAIEFPCQLAGYYIMNFFGRRKPLAFSLIFAAASCLATIPVPGGSTYMLWLRITLAMLGKCGVTVAFNQVYIFSAELNPTVVRNVGVGLSSTCARLGSVLAPFVKELGTATTQSIPMIVFGSLTALSGLLVLLLPETMDQPILNTLEEGEQFGKKERKARESS